MSESSHADRHSRRRHDLLALLNVATSNLNTALTIAGAFIVTPALLHGLGDARYGGWLLLNSVVGYLRLLDQGTSVGTMRLGAAALARRDDKEAAKVFDTTAGLFLAAGTIALILTALLAVLIPRVYGASVGYDAVPIICLGLASAIDLGLRVYPAGLRTKSLFVHVEGVEIITFLIFKFGLVLYYANTLSYRTLAILTLGETLSRNLIVIGISRSHCPFVRDLHPLKFDRAVLRELMNVSAAIAILTIADVVRFQMDALVIGYFMPHDATAIAVFGVGQRLPSTAYYAIGVIYAVLIPRFSSLSATGSSDEARALLRRASLLTGLASIYVLGNCGLLGPNFLELWLNKPWVAQSGPVLLILLPGYLVAVLTGPTTGMLLAAGRLKGQAVITVIEASLNLVLSVVLVKRYGVIGVAIGTAIPMLLVRGLVYPLVVRSALGISVRAYYGLYLRALLIGAVYLAIVARLAWVPMTSYLRFIELGALSTLVFAVMVPIAVPEVGTLLMKRLGLRRAAADRPPDLTSSAKPAASDGQTATSSAE